MTYYADTDFLIISSAELRPWVEDHPGHVNDWDWEGLTPLYAAARANDVALIEWLIDVMGADVNGRTEVGKTPLHGAPSLLVVRALLERNADPTLKDEDGETAVMTWASWGQDDCIACLLEDKRVVALINSRSTDERNALHLAAWPNETSTLRILLQAGADPCLRDRFGETPRQRCHGPGYEAAEAVLEEGVDAKRAACLLMIRRLVVAQPGTVGLPVEEEEGGLTKEEQDWRRMAAFVVGVGEGGGCKKDMFTELIDLLLPTWSLLRRGLGQQVAVQAGEQQA